MRISTRLPGCVLIGLACVLAAISAHAQTGQPSTGIPGAPARPAVERPTTLIPREGCVTTECHPGVKNHTVLHGPVHANACDGCHTLKDVKAHTFEPTRTRSEICTLCHTVPAPVGANLHKPFAEGECLSCHDPHGGTEKAILRGKRYSDACKTCHEDITGAHNRVHGPVAAGACGACHLPHASELPKLLSAGGRELCLRCHLSIGLQIESRSTVHKPVLGDCSVCHVPHANDRPSLLVADPSELCKSCHQNIAHAIEGATSQHAAVTSKRSCLNCHAAHASDHPRLLREETKTLCMECHNAEIKLEDGTVLVNMKQVLDNGKSLHGAIADRSCVVCHQIHGSEHRRLLTQEYPSDLYYPFSETAYALCFSCHDRQLVALARTDAATAFRNGDRNLHYVHVNRNDKGRSCRICHDSHAANSERHIRDEIPFGPKGWKLPIRYQQLADGGKCGAGCHAAYEYNRINPVTYTPPAPDGSWKGADLVPGSKAEPGNPPGNPPGK